MRSNVGKLAHKLDKTPVLPLENRVFGPDQRVQMSQDRGPRLPEYVCDGDTCLVCPCDIRFILMRGLDHRFGADP